MSIHKSYLADARRKHCRSHWTGTDFWQETAGRDGCSIQETLLMTANNRLLGLTEAATACEKVFSLRAVTLGARGKLKSRQVKFIHVSVFSHAVLIVLLAKAMFYVSW